MRKAYRKVIVVITVALLFACSSTVNATADPFGEEAPAQGYVVVYTEDGQELFAIGSRVHIGDQYQSEDNKMYEIFKIEGDKAFARMLYEVSLDSIEIPSWGAVVPAQGRKGKIGIYHTHTDESYVPTDGTASKKRGGGVIEVGKTMAQQLKEQGIDVAFSDKNHLPHDSGAYKRSRRTALDLLQKQGVDALVDVHRDAVPARYYRANVAGQQVARIRLVVGRQNPNVAANRRFAQGLKKLADQKYPGLIKDIFFGKGSYNQDLSPRAILVEAGTHEVSKGTAQRGVALFADVLSTYLYGTRQEGAAGRPAANTGSARAMLWLLALLAVGSVAFVMINSGSWSEVKESLLNLGKKQFTSSLSHLPEEQDSDEDE